ncbi:MAG: site-specific integrase, partial [Oscillospiraceae bacterium]|nr:site-specific integrase [Oscillospiraceae bacterium]
VAPQTLKQSTIDSRINVMDNHILPEMGHFKLRDINPAMLDKHFTKLQKGGYVQKRYYVKEGFELKDYVYKCGFSLYKMEQAGVYSCNSLSRLSKREIGITKEVGERVCKFLGLKFKDIFYLPPVKPLNSNFIKRIESILSSVFEVAVKKQIMKENPMRLVTPPKKAEFKHVALTPEQAKLLIELLKNSWNLTCKNFLIFILLTGLRSGEARSLTWNDINFESGILSVNKNVDARNRVTEPKTVSGTRVIRLIKPVCEMLQDYKIQLENYKTEMGDVWTENNLVFPNTTGGFLAESQTISYLKKVIKNTEIPQNLSVHSLRHSFVSIMISQGENATNVAAVIGHASTSTTLEIYAHSFAVQQALAMENVGNIMLGTNEKENA